MALAVAIKDEGQWATREFALPLEIFSPEKLANTVPSSEKTYPSIRFGDDVLRAIQLVQLGTELSPKKQLATSTEPYVLTVHSYPIYEALYSKLGRWVGAYASGAAKKSVLENWRRFGEGGVHWLVSRAAREENLEALNGASSAITSMGKEAAPHIIQMLDSLPQSEWQSAVRLLQILEWFRPDDIPTSMVALLEDIIRKAATSFEKELREAAYRCTPLLANAANVAASLYARESDSELRDLLREVGA